MRLTDIEPEYFNIGITPCVLYGDSKAKKAVLYIHGLCGNKEEAERFARLAIPQGFCVLAMDLPEHGERTDNVRLLPWEVIPELKAVFDYASKKWSVYLRAESIGAYFSLLALGGANIEKCLLVSPLTDMVAMIKGMLKTAGADEVRLEREKNIQSGNQVISWEYYEYAKSHPVKEVTDKTSIISSSIDYVVGEETIRNFAKKCKATHFELQGGEHYFHTPDQLAFLENHERAWLGCVNQTEKTKAEAGYISSAEYGELKELFLNIDKIHTTPGGAARIIRNLCIQCDPAEYCKKIILDKLAKGCFCGKNLYITLNGEEITLNRKSYTIKTSKRKKECNH